MRVDGSPTATRGSTGIGQSTRHQQPATPGQRLRRLRETLGLSLRATAHRSETISHATIHKIESDRSCMENVSLGTLIALARAYRLELGTMMAIALGDLGDRVYVETLELARLAEENRRYRRALSAIRSALVEHAAREGGRPGSEG